MNTRHVVLAFFAGLALSVFAYNPVANALGQPLTGVYAEILSVGTTAERVTEEIGPVSGWKSCTIWNNSATVLYVGGDDVDSTDGFPICTDTSSCPDSVFTSDSTQLWAVAASGTLTPNLICGR